MKTILREYIKQFFLSADVQSYPSLYEKKKGILLSLFLYFFCAVSVTFIIVAIVKKELSFIPVDGSFLILSCVLLYFLKIKKRLNEVSIIFIVIICLICTLFILSGGLHNTGILVAVLMPLPVILLLGKKNGMWVLFALFLVNLSGFLFFENASWFPSYDQHWLGRVAVAFIILSLMAYSSESVFELLYLRLEKVTESFKTSQERYKNLAINKEKFLSLISHDLSGHIGNFAAISNMLHEQFELMEEDEKKKLIRQLATISEQNFHLLHDLLKWSTVQNEIIPYTPKPIKLEQIYREVIVLFDSAVEEKNISVFLKIKSNAEVFADYNMLGSILRNLVSNAVKFSEPGGEIRISASERKDFMLVSVSDKGIGLETEDLHRVNASISFSNPGTLDEAGTGIGLILVKEFVQKNRGEFFMESKKGKGTTASFTIPLVD